MKKKIFGGAFIIALAAVATFNVNFNNTGVDCDFAMANVEALAEEAPPTQTVDCYKTFSSNGTTVWVSKTICLVDGKCATKDCRQYSDKSTCTK